MSDGDKLYGVGPKMLVALVFSVLLIAIVVGKWNQIAGVSYDNVRIDIDNLPRALPAPPVAPPPPVYDPPPRPPAENIEPYQQFIQQLMALQRAGKLDNASADRAGLQMFANIYQSPKQWQAFLAMMDPQERRVLEPLLKMAMNGGM